MYSLACEFSNKLEEQPLSYFSPSEEIDCLSEPAHSPVNSDEEHVPGGSLPSRSRMVYYSKNFNDPEAKYFCSLNLDINA